MQSEIKTNILNKFKSIINEQDATIIENSIQNYTNTQITLLGLSLHNPLTLLIYKEKARSIYDNLNPESYFNNIELLTKIKNNNFDLSKIAFIDIRNFRQKELWKTIRQNQEILDKNLMGLKPTTETDQFLCKKCKKRKTTFYTMQIRSADEPATSFITCLNCEYSWRE